MVEDGQEGQESKLASNSGAWFELFRGHSLAELLGATELKAVYIH
jgi:hypothetical protein